MVIVDRTPAQLRAQWSADGLYDDLDLYRAFAQRVRQQPDMDAVVDDRGPISYRGLLTLANRFANLLDRHGIGTGDIVAVQLPNRRESCAFDYAIAAVGAVNLPIPINYGQHEVQNLLARSGASVYITIDQFRSADQLAVIEAIRDDLPELRAVLTFGMPRAGMVPIDDALADEWPTTWDARDIDPNAPVRISVTSGTEAFPKLVVNGHNAIGRPYEVLWGNCGITQGSRILLGSPLGSGMGQIVTGAILARLGATVIVMDLFSASAALQLTGRHRPTHWWLVPTMVQLMLADQAFPRTDTSSVEFVLCAGAQVPANLVRRLDAELGWRCLPVYGFVDGGLCATRTDDDLEARAETVGRPNPRTNEIRIVDSGGRQAAPGEVGEIASRGPFSPLCYLNSPELDDRYRMADGWVRSGDLGTMNEAGYLKIVGRVKDIVVRGGLNISPAEIEEQITAHPDVIQAVCVGYPDELMGERVCACLVLRTGAVAPTVESLGAFLSGRGLMKNKWPERVIAFDALPTNPTGKVLRRVLRQQVAEAAVAVPMTVHD